MDSFAATKSKKKFFPCFRSTASNGPVRTVRGVDAADEQVFPFMAVEERNGMMLHNVQPFDGCGNVSGRQKKGGGGGALSRALKAVLFGTSLAKKIRKRKRKQKENSNEENQRRQLLSSISSRSSDPNFRNSSTCSSRTSAPFSSASFSSSSPTSPEINEISFRFHPTASNRLFRQINLRKTSRCWFVLLVGLLSLVLWEKIGATVCTSIWILCFHFYRREIGFRSPDDKASAAAMSSDEYKKRTILEGFLNRDRSAVRSSITHID
ncbi:hypothetical protein SDJN02_22873, partial [Cucurbita argyrosperma subsp. argyrosperma]